MEIEELSAAKILRETKFGESGTLVWSFHAKESAQKNCQNASYDIIK